MYYEQLFQTTEAKMNFVKGLIRISKADGEISPERRGSVRKHLCERIGVV